MDPRAHDPTIVATTETVRPSIISPAPTDLLARPGELETSPALLRRISWGSTFAGAAVASVLSIWFNLLGLAIGLAAFEPMTSSGTGFGVGTVIWVLCSSIICLFAGGWVAGYLTGAPRSLDRGLHGVVTWSVATLFGLYVFMSGASKAVAGTASVLGDVAGGAAPAVTNVAEDADLPPELQQDVERVIEDFQNDPQLQTSLMNVLGGEPSAADRKRLIGELTARGNMSEDEAEKTLVGWEQKAEELKYTVAEKTEKAASAISAVAFLGVLSMFLGLGSSTLGAIAAYPDRRQGRRIIKP